MYTIQERTVLIISALTLTIIIAHVMSIRGERSKHITDQQSSTCQDTITSLEVANCRVHTLA